jgi:hypothetical protein
MKPTSNICRYYKERSVDLIIWIIFGLIVGVVAKFLMPGRDPGVSVSWAPSWEAGSGGHWAYTGMASRLASSWRWSER